MSWFDNFLTGGADDYNDQQQNGINASNGLYNDAINRMSPFYQFGQGEMGAYGQGVNAMSDPNSFINNIMQGYSMSPQAQFQQQEGTKGINAAAAASGQLGSGPEQKQMATFNQQLTNNDQNNYLSQRMGVYDQFLNGAGNITGMGMNAAGQMGGWGMDQASNLAQLYNQKAQGSMYGDQSFNNFLGTAAGAMF